MLAGKSILVPWGTDDPFAGMSPQVGWGGWPVVIRVAHSSLLGPFVDLLWSGGAEVAPGLPACRPRWAGAALARLTPHLAWR